MSETTPVLLKYRNHLIWRQSFNNWFHTASRVLIIRHLREGVPLSPANSRFLAAILDGSIKPLSGKVTAYARFKNDRIDRKISDLSASGYSRKEILAELKRIGLLKNHADIGAVDQRLYGEKLGFWDKLREVDKKFIQLYRKTRSNTDVGQSTVTSVKNTDTSDYVGVPITD